MITEKLSGTVFKFIDIVHKLPDPELERSWQWKGYDEGVRFACFRMMERLRLLAAEVEQARLAQGIPLTAAQRAMAQYHVAFREMQALLWGISNEAGERLPAPGEWPLRLILPHIIGADRAFFVVINYTVERARTDPGLPLEMSDEYFDAFQASDEFGKIAEKGSLSVLLDYYQRWHSQVLAVLGAVLPQELPLPSVFWEPEPLPVQFRLHRFESHLRQHTVQMEKALAALNLNQHEADRLARLILAALGEAEGAAIGANSPQVEQLASDCDAELESLRQAIKAVLE